jgi:dienelactone hydrolase
MSLFARAVRPALRPALAGVTLVSVVVAGGPAYAAPASAPSKDWTIEAVEGGGHRVTLRLDEPLPVRDAAPELAVDGISLGAARESPDGETLTLVTTDPRAAKAASVQVAWNGEVPAAAPTPSGRAGTHPAPAPEQRKSLSVDPATPGKYAVRTASYDLGDTAVALSGIGGRPAEIRADVYLPDTVGRRPLVLFLHGRHSACYNPTTRETSNTQWPCPEGQRPIDSYTGYEGPARVLASHGYVVVSISANGVNATDNPFSDDRGALARGELVMKHLDLLNDATHGKGGDQALIDIFNGRLDMGDIGLMGHSRGGEGVVKAALLNDGRAHPYGIEAVLPLAPTDFARATLPNIPMSVLLPYCDGDVSNQQGQHFYDDTRYADLKERAFQSSLMVMGVNHNFFNTEWTPGVAVAPASDDWRNQSDPVCGNTAPSRLSTSEQYAVGIAYIAGFFRLVQGGEREFLPLFDGSGGTAASAGRAIVHGVASSPASDRRDVATFTSMPDSVKIEGSATGAICAGMNNGSPQSGLPTCATTLTTAQAPSWTPATYAPNVPSTPVLRFFWTGTSGAVKVSLPADAGDVTRYDALTFRAALDEVSSPADLAVTVTDRKGGSATVKVSDVSDALTRFPGTASPLPKTWLRTVRIPLDSLKGIDLEAVRDVKISGASASGGTYLADLAFTDSSEGATRTGGLPQVSIENLTVPEGDGPSTATMALRLSYRTNEPVRVNVQTIASGATAVVPQAAQEVVIPRGATSATFQVPVQGNTTVASGPQSFQVVASAPGNAVIGNSFARLVVTDDETAA